MSATAASAPDTLQRIKNTINTIVEEYGISNRLRYGLIVFGREASVKLRFGEETADLDMFKAKIASARQPSGEPDLQKALEEANKLFKSEPRRPDAKKVLVVISDKRSSSSPESVKSDVMLLEEQDVTIVPVAVGTSADLNELETITSNRGYLLKKERELDPDTTAEEIMEKVLKGTVESN